MLKKHPTKTIELTPKKLREWWDESSRVFAAGLMRQRQFSEVTARTYMIDMHMGNWSQTHQGIAISRGGVILDGQHRIWALLALNLTISMDVTFYEGSWDELQSVMESFDRGRVRTVGQIRGLRGEQNAFQIAAVCNNIALFYAGHTMRLTPNQSTYVSSVYGPHIEAAIHAEGDSSFKRTSVLAAAAIARACHPDELDSFLSGVLVGENLKQGSPAHTLRSWLIKNQGNSNTFRFQTMCAFFKAFLAHLNRKPISSIHSLPSAVAQIKIMDQKNYQKLQKAFAFTLDVSGPKAFQMAA